MGADSSDNPSKSPATMGQTVTVDATLSSNNKKSIGITVEKVLRGDQAWRKVAEARYYNSRPTDGNEYIVVLVRIDLDHDSQNYIPSEDDFNLVNAEGDRYLRPILYSSPLPHFDIFIDNKKDTSSCLVYTVPKNVATDKLFLAYKGKDSKNLAYFQLQVTPESEKTVDLSHLQLPSNISSMPDETELSMLLEQNFSRLYNTSQGDMTFEFKIIRNEKTIFPYDYRVHTLFDYSKYVDLKQGNSITEEQRALIFQQLKDHQEKIGMTLTALYPGVKFTGSYYDSWYKYPYLKVGHESFNLNEWSNYDESSVDTNSYQTVKPSFFRWKN